MKEIPVTFCTHRFPLHHAAAEPNQNTDWKANVTARLSNEITVSHEITADVKPVQVFILAEKGEPVFKTLDTIGNCQRPVFTVCVSQHFVKHNITNL